MLEWGCQVLDSKSSWFVCWNQISCGQDHSWVGLTFLFKKKTKPTFSYLVFVANTCLIFWRLSLKFQSLNELKNVKRTENQKATFALIPVYSIKSKYLGSSKVPAVLFKEYAFAVDKGCLCCAVSTFEIFPGTLGCENSVMQLLAETPGSAAPSQPKGFIQMCPL